MQKYIVYTHCGAFETTATTPEKAISNVRWRMFGRFVAAARYVQGWTVRAA